MNGDLFRIFYKTVVTEYNVPCLFVNGGKTVSSETFLPEKVTVWENALA